MCGGGGGGGYQVWYSSGVEEGKRTGKRTDNAAWGEVAWRRQRRQQALAFEPTSTYGKELELGPSRITIFGGGGRGAGGGRGPVRPCFEGHGVRDGWHRGSWRGGRGRR